MPLLEELQIKYAHIDQISFERLDNDIILLHVDNGLATATISLYGGQILEWKPHSQKHAVLWRSDLIKFSPGKAIRAGVPICWPWFGAHPVDPLAPAHGFARISPWRLDSVSTTSNGATELCMTMLASEHGRRYPDFEATLSVRMTIGEVLAIDLMTENTSKNNLVLTEALHAYFKMSDIEHVQIGGLNNTQYVDLIDHQKVKTRSGHIRFKEELGQVYLDTQSDCVIEDPQFSRTIKISKSGSNSTVVWNPWLVTASKMDDLGSSGWTSMVCVETANALANTVTLEPGQRHSLCVIYSVQESAVLERNNRTHH